MARKKRNCSSGIGGQAVLEGVMMKNKDDYAVAVRKSDGEIVLDMDYYKGVLGGSVIKKIPFFRGIFNFIDSMILGTRMINYSASFYVDEEMEPTKFDKVLDKIFKGKGESVLMGLTTIVAILLAVGIFILLPFYISNWFKGFINNASMVLILEGVLRISIFLLYILAISLMKDIRRLYAYHGAEHKCINCIEKGRPLTTYDVMRSSRLHKRCGTSFMFFVIFVSIIIFFFIQVDNIWLKAGLRVALIPLIAGISYEIIRWAGRSNNILVLILSAPGMLIQRMTTKEPDENMVEVAIQAIEAIFDWKAYLRETFGYEVDESWTEDEEGNSPNNEELESDEEDFAEDAEWQPDE